MRDRGRPGRGHPPLTYVGWLYFDDVLSFPAFTSSGTTFSYHNQDVTLSGDAELLAPDGTTTPLASKALAIGGPGNPNLTTTVTGADGSFSVTFQVPATGPYWAYYPNDGSVIGNSPAVNLKVTTLRVHLTAALTASHVNQGTPVKVHGTVTYKDNGVWKPLAGKTVWLCSSSDPYCGVTWAHWPARHTVTDAGGRFSMRVPTARNDVWTVLSAQTTYFRAAKKLLPLTVALPNAITGFTASLDSFATINYSGCATAPGAAAIEYAAKRAGPWHRLPVKPDPSGSSCKQGSHYGEAFSGTAVARLAVAYYRAALPATPVWQGATSRSVYSRQARQPGQTHRPFPQLEGRKNLASPK